MGKPDTIKILVLNGPNLNLLGTREPDTYGTQTLSDIEAVCNDTATPLSIETTWVQSNIEGELVTALQDADGTYDGVILNAAAYTHTSVALHDAIVAIRTPVIEVHLSNIFAREDYRHHSFISDVAAGVICGFGATGYSLALKAFHTMLQGKQS